MKVFFKRLLVVIVIIQILLPVFISTISMANDILQDEVNIDYEDGKNDINSQVSDEEQENIENTELIEADELDKEDGDSKVENEKEEAKEESKVEENIGDKEVVFDEESEILDVLEQEKIQVVSSEMNLNNDVKDIDGIYTIESALDSNKILEVTNGVNENCANVRIWQNRNIFQQQFEFVYNSQIKSYTIKARHSGKVLDVAYGGMQNGTNVWQYDNNGTVAQQWILEDAGNGYFYIVSKCNGLYLDIAGANIANGTNIQLYEGNSTNAQKFKLVEVPKLECDKIIENGEYCITSALSSAKAIQVENGAENNCANVNLFDKKSVEYQKFEFKYDEKLKTYTIGTKYSNKVLDVAYGGKQSGVNVWQYDENSSDAQQWVLQDAGDGYYYIVSKCNGLYVDIEGGSIKNGTNIRLYDGNFTNAQKFKFEKIDNKIVSSIILDGKYNIHTEINEKKVLKAEQNTNRVSISTYGEYINLSQEFEFMNTGNGYYTIRELKSGKYVTAENGNHNNGAKISLENRSNTTRQEWIIKDVQGKYTIISRYNGLSIDVPAANSTDGVYLQLYQENQTIAQQFNIIEVRELESNKLLENGIYYINIGTDTSKFLDITNGSYNNGTNLQIWDYSSVQQKKFQVTYNEEGKYYEIISVNSGKLLDVAYGGKQNGANVWQYEKNNTDSQKWILQDAGNGYFYIISKGSLLYLDVAGGGKQNGANVQVYEGNGTSSQKFRFSKTKVINEDLYHIAIKSNLDKYFDISGGSKEENANLQIWQKDDVNQQIFEIKYIDDTYCKILARNSDMALTVENDNVVQATYNDLPTQQWIIEVVGNGYYKIKLRDSNKCMDVKSNGTANGTNIGLYEDNNTNAQAFSFIKLTRRRGIDVSEWQGDIDWKKVRKSGDVEFAIIRAGYRGYRTGKIVTDLKFEQNIKGAAENGIDMGLYFFTQATTAEEAREEANYVLNLIRKYNIQLRYPIFIDTEASGADLNDGRADALDKDTRTIVCKAFIDTIENAGYRGGVYASRNWFYDNLNVSQLDRGQIWVAQYTFASKTDYKYRYNIWQYTSKGLIEGINTFVDLNICYTIY